MAENVFIPSAEQQAIFDFISKGVGSAVINACAGSGKSKTITEGLKYIKKGKKILFVAFNRDIVQSLKEKINSDPAFDDEFKKNIRIYTYHGLGYRVTQEMFKKKDSDFNGIKNVDEEKYKRYVYSNIENIAGKFYNNLDRNEKVIYNKNVIKLIDYARENKCKRPKDIQKIADKYGVTVEFDECETVSKILDWGKKNTETLDYLDFIWLPHINNFMSRMYKFDYIFIDEAQDSSPIEQDLLIRVKGRGARCIAVGDKCQTINSWCGSDEKAFEDIKKIIGDGIECKEFPLSTSFRCPKNIVDHANSRVSGLNITYNKDGGEIKYSVNINDIQPGDIVMCRNTAPLVDFYRILLRLGKKVYIRNMELGSELITILKHLPDDCKDIDCVILNIKIQLIKTWNLETLRFGCDEKETIYSQPVVNYYEGLKIIEAFKDDVKTKEELIDKLDSVINNGVKDSEKGDYILLSTIHRAKGLECDNAYVLCPSLLPSKLAKQDWEKKAEKYLEYVMITRAKKTLNYIDEQHGFKYDQWLSNESIMYSNLKKIRKELEENFE